jgi:hypothetical protein
MASSGPSRYGTTKRPAVWAIFTAAVLSLGALNFAAPASADGTDDAFISALQRSGLVVNNRDVAIAMGHSICRELAGGSAPTAVAVGLMSNAGVPPKQTGHVMGIAVGSYCPQLQHALSPNS